MGNYVNDLSIYGLMNKNAFINYDSDKLSFYKNKIKSKVVFFERLTEDEESKYESISYMYMNEDPKDKRAYCMDEIVSIISNDMFENMSGKKYREIRETVNKYKNKVEIKPINKETKSSIIEMIEKWRYADNGGMKYKWQEHAGIDKAIIDRYIKEDLREAIIGMSFWINGECIGYYMIERFVSDITDNKFEYKYLTRKVLNKKNLRNITEYVDWLTFKQLYRNHCIYHPDFNDFLINWGCSSGGVHWYKTHKWPLYSTTPRWFMTIKNNKI